MNSRRPSADMQQAFAHQKGGGPVECLGKTFPNDAARREHYLGLLREKLRDPEFRKTPGFPIGKDEDILRMSDPPYYTACPNPFLEEFVGCYGKPYDPNEPYHRDPFAVDVSVGKTDALYKAHGYHTKVPHLAIVPSILHYTKPGDLVLDGFCGSGMTGVAAQWCGSAPQSYRTELEKTWKRDGLEPPQWGARRVILGDLSPAATFIAAGYNLPFDVTGFAVEARRILDETEAEIGWMYETLHTDGVTKGRIEYTVWSEVFTCPECANEVNFVAEALDEATRLVRDEFPCPNCGTRLTKDTLDRAFETSIDPVLKTPGKRIRFEPILIRYRLAGKVHEKVPDAVDHATLASIAKLPLPVEVPANRFPIEAMYHGSRIEPKGFTHIHQFFLPRAAHALATLWRKADMEPNYSLRRSLLFLVEQAIVTMTRQNRFQPQGFKQVNKYLPGVYYIPSHHCEISPWYAIGARSDRIASTFQGFVRNIASIALTTGDCAQLSLDANTVDYIFTDPPFGANIFYADLNYLVESWHRVRTDASTEAIVDTAKQKGTNEYQDLMRACFEAYYRVLKPGRWMTVVFSNSSNAIWRAIQEAMGTAGLVVADVRTLDKQQGSYRQVTSSAVKQDLVISAYKPSRELARGPGLGSSSSESAWSFVTEHLSNVPVFSGRAGEVETISERTGQVLLDRMIAFHVQRSLDIPLSAPEFLEGLSRRFPSRDGMYFLPEQVATYDRKRTTVAELRQLTLFVTDEATAIQWVRQQLQRKPQTFQELQPQLMREIQSWMKHERTVELREILQQNFLEYDGNGPVPNPIHAYLSTNFKELRNRPKDDSELRQKAKGRWYVPDPARQGDLEKLREKALLREFDDYKASTQRKLKQFRTEALRAGFKAAYDERDYRTIVDVAKKIPENVLQEDEKLLMYYDVASMRLGEE